MPAGRPTTYKPEFVQRANRMAGNGATDAEIARNLGVSIRVLYKWKTRHAEFGQALKLGKEGPDDRVEATLFRAACGYTQKSVKIFLGKDGVPVYAPFIEHVQPNVTAQIFWLKNRKPNEWRDKQDVEHSGGIIWESSIPRPERPE